MTTAVKNPTLALNPDFTLGPEALRKTAENALAKAAKSLDALAAIPAAKKTFENTVAALDVILDDLSVETAGSTFPKYVSTEKAVREAAHGCEGDLEKFSVDVFTRMDLYEGLKSFAQKAGALDPVDQKLLDKYLKDFKRNGLDLEPLDRARYKTLSKILLDLELAFGQNLNEIKDTLTVTREELDGLKDAFIEGLEKTEDGKYKITMDYPDVHPFMAEAKNSDARRRLQTLFQSRAVPDNIALLEEIFELRRRRAKMLGFESHGHYALVERMAKSPETVAEFQGRLQKRLSEKAKPELARLAELKKKEEPEAGGIKAWDFSYYYNNLKKSEYNVDETLIQEYFPMDQVLSGMFEIYQTIFNVRYEEKKPPHGWHPDIKYYETFDAESGEPLGRFYLDLYPRDGKFKHAAAFPLIRGRLESDGAYRLPLNSMVANFNKPSGGRPSLLKHSEVETLFHEFGHIMHGALTRARYARFSGTHVVWDFVEAPSQMLENWCWQKEVLKKISGHYKTGKPLPDDLLENMIKAKNLCSGQRYLGQLAYGLIDQAYHGAETVDLDETYRRISEKLRNIPVTDATRSEASFGHLCGYDAAYYSYLWAEVFSAELFSVFEKEGVLNPETGKRYRKIVLERGGEGDERDYVKEFTGREPGEEAFLKSIGL